MSQTLPDVISPSIKASVTPDLTKLIDAITDGTGTADLVEYVLLLVDSIKEKKDFADDIAAFFGEGPAQQLTDDLFALILKEASTSSIQSSAPPSHVHTHDSIPPLESVSAFPFSQPSVIISPPSSSPLPVTTQSADISQPQLASARVPSPQPSGSRIVKLNSASPTTSSKQVNVNKVSSRSDRRSRSPQPQSNFSQPISHTANKQISLKRNRDDDTDDQPARKSITLKRDANNDTSGKPRLTIRKRPHDSVVQQGVEQELSRRQIHIAKPSSSSVLSAIDSTPAEHGDADMEDDSTGLDYVPILTDVNAPFQPQQLQSRSQNHAVKPSNGRKHRLNVNESAGDSSVPAVATTTRCLFFPSCSKGDACPFFHPPPCTYFPKCRQGDKCPNYHPPCKFGAACTNALCTYSHPANRVSSGAHTIPAGANPCRFGDQCTRSDCYYTHPRDKQAKGPRDGICAFDPNCTSIGCSFQHPQREAADQAWMAS